MIHTHMWMAAPKYIFSWNVAFGLHESNSQFWQRTLNTMLLKLRLRLLMGVSSSKAANPGCNLCWNFWCAPAMDFLGGCSIYSQSCWGVKIDLAPPVLPYLFPKISRAKPGLKASLLFAPRGKSGQRLCQTQLLCPAASPWSSSKVVSVLVVSQWYPCVLDERPGDLNHPWSGVFYQALLQPSIIWIPQKGCGRLIFPQGFQWLLQVLPSLIPAPVSFLTVLVLMPPRGWGLLDDISVTDSPFLS